MTENKIPLRNEADKNYTWHTEDLFANDEIWEKNYKELLDKAPLIEGFKNTITNSGKDLYNALNFYNELYEELDRLYVYAYMKFKLSGAVRKGGYSGSCHNVTDFVFRSKNIRAYK